MTEALKRMWIVLAAVFVLGLCLRIYGLGTKLPVFVDEAIYIRWAQVMRAEETLRFLPLSDGKQPLFMWLVIPALKVFPDPLFAGRFVSVLAGMGIAVGTWMVSWLLFRSKRLAVLAFLLAAACPFLVFFDRKALVDSLLSFWGVAAFILGVLFVKDPRLDLALLEGFALGGAWLTKTPGELFFILLPTTLLAADRENLIGDRKFLIKVAAGMGLAFVLGFGIYNILRLGPNFHMIGLRNLDYVYPLREVLSHPLSPLIGNMGSVIWWLVILLTLPVLVLVALGAVMMFFDSPGKALLLLVWGTAPIFLEALVAKVFTARYILFAIPYLLILAAYGLDAVLSKGKILKVAALFILAAPLFVEDFLLVAVPSSAWLPSGERNGYLEEWTAGYGLREIAVFLKSQPRERKILVGTEGFFGTTPDGLEIYLEGDNNIRVIGLAYPVKEVPLSLRSALADNTVYLVVNKSRFQVADPKREGLDLIGSFPRPRRADGTEDTLLFFRLRPVLSNK